MWEDYVIAVGAIIFIVALVPSLRGDNKPDLKTSLITGTTLLLFVAANVSLRLWFAAITTLILAVLWLVLAYQVIRPPAGGGLTGLNRQRRGAREAALQQVLALFDESDQITNNDVETALGVSDSTAYSYLEELEQRQLIQQMQAKGRGVFYKKTT